MSIKRRTRSIFPEETSGIGGPESEFDRGLLGLHGFRAQSPSLVSVKYAEELQIEVSSAIRVIREIRG